jgi:outer membrane murein-binding lipoprotein Lpp
MRRKAEATTKKQAKGAMALAAKQSATARRGADKRGTRKRGRDEEESADELSKKAKDGEEESEEEESEEESKEESNEDSTSSETEIAVLEAETVVKEGRGKLQALERDGDALKSKIEAAKKNNVNKNAELRQTLNAYPSAVSTLSLYNWILHMLIDGLSRRQKLKSMRVLLPLLTKRRRLLQCRNTSSPGTSHSTA